jgi:hypothetical protein
MIAALSQGGVGVGTVWGDQLRQRYLADAGFTAIDAHAVEGDIFNVYYLCRKVWGATYFGGCDRRWDGGLRNRIEQGVRHRTSVCGSEYDPATSVRIWLARDGGASSAGTSVVSSIDGSTVDFTGASATIASSASRSDAGSLTGRRERAQLRAWPRPEPQLRKR